MLPGVSKTAILTLRARAEEHVRADRVFEDPLAAQWYAQVDWPSELDTWYDDSAQSTLAFRADDIDHLTRKYRASVAALSVVELGCGLSTRQRRLRDLALEAWVDLDLPEVVALRERWGAGAIGHRHLPSSVLDFSWMDQIEGEPAGQLFIAEGLLYYLPRADVDRLFAELRRRFSGSAILFDLLGRNDYPTLFENTRRIGTPIQWKFELDADEALASFGLGAVEGLLPDAIMDEGLARYWPRFSQKMQVAIYYAKHSPLIWSGRSAMICGRL